jgi:hypothetical protein
MGGAPLLEFYSGVEVAFLQGKSRGLEWTGVLLVLIKVIWKHGRIF